LAISPATNGGVISSSRCAPSRSKLKELAYLNSGLELTITDERIDRKSVFKIEVLRSEGDASSRCPGS
jgi:hypothetical protein